MEPEGKRAFLLGILAGRTFRTCVICVVRRDIKPIGQTKELLAGIIIWANVWELGGKRVAWENVREIRLGKTKQSASRHLLTVPEYSRTPISAAASPDTP